MSGQPYSLVAMRYSSKMLAREALFSLELLRHEGSIQLRDAAVLYKDRTGRITTYRSGELTSGQHAALLGIMGLVLGLPFGRPIRGLVGGAALGGILSILRSRRRNRPLFGLSKNLSPDQSALYMLIVDANWPVVKERMAPLWEKSSVLLNQPLPAHDAPLTDLLVDHPQPQDDERNGYEQSQIAEDKSQGSLSTPEESTTATAKVADFTQIRGIGSVIHQQLVENHVHTYAQLATMTTQEVADLAGVPLSLLLRYDIITQAKQLAAAEE